MTNRRRLPLLILAIALQFCAAFAVAQSSVYKPGAPLLMWKVSSPTNSAYVLGSVHLGDPSLYPLPAVIEDAFQRSSVLIVEVDIRKVDPLAMQKLMAAAAYPAGDDLFHHIKPETRAKLTAYLSPYHLPPEIFARVRPWALGVTIESLAMIKAGLNPNDGIDMHFLNEAGNKRVEQLEDAEWQMKLLEDMPESISDEWLSSAMSQAEGSQDRWAKLERYWSQGAADKMDELVSSDSMSNSAEEKAYERRLREDRNPHMTDRLEKCLHSTESCFMVVGAAHVVGKEGIVQELQARGYRVEQAVVGKAASK
jgi:uncharacterized protein YbaP (TraB family)